MRRPLAAFSTGILGCAAVLAGCGPVTDQSDATSAPSTTIAVPPPSTASTEAAPARCQESAPRGTVEHSLQDFAFDTGSVTVSLTLPGQSSRCYSFPRWGNPDPAVPIDSLLFLFKGPGVDGVTVEMLVGDLTVRTKVNARVAVAIGETTYQGEGCSMDLTALSGSGVAGSFICPTATEVFGNPFAPLDEPQPEPSPSMPLPTAAVSGWFAVAR